MGDTAVLEPVTDSSRHRGEYLVWCDGGGINERHQVYRVDPQLPGAPYVCPNCHKLRAANRVAQQIHISDEQVRPDDDTREFESIPTRTQSQIMREISGILKKICG